MMLRVRAGKLSNRDRVLRGARLALLGCSLGFLSIGHAGDYSDHAALQSVIDAAQKRESMRTGPGISSVRRNANRVSSMRLRVRLKKPSHGMSIGRFF